MKIKLFNYRDEPVEYEIGELKDIKIIRILVLSGDEIANVMYKDGERASLDSCDTRCEDFFDTSYDVYVEGYLNRLNDPNFVNRQGSYDYEPNEGAHC